MIKHGFYSAKFSAQFGTKIWEDLHGQPVEVCFVDDDPMGAGYGWSDKVYVGPVVKYLREGMPDPNPPSFVTQPAFR